MVAGGPSVKNHRAAGRPFVSIVFHSRVAPRLQSDYEKPMETKGRRSAGRDGGVRKSALRRPFFLLVFHSRIEA